MQRTALFVCGVLVELGLTAVSAMAGSASASDTVLAKRLPSGNRVTVVWELRPAEEVAAWEHAESAWPIIAPTHLYVILHTRAAPRGVALWTNRHLLVKTYEYSLTNHTAFDICEIGTNLWLCYKEGPDLLCEPVRASPPGSPRERFLLERDWYPYSVWTNAVFSLDTNGVPVLTAYHNKGAVLLWRYCDLGWTVDRGSSWPKSRADAAYRLGAKLRYEGGFRWSVVRKNPPLPTQSKP